MLRKSLGPLLVALVAVATVLTTIAPEGFGPGVTCDELYHVNRGKEIVTALRQQGLAFFLPSNIRRNFYWQPGDAPVQAPLGYWILGSVHHLFDPAPDDAGVLSISAARFAPALAFGVLVAMTGIWLTRREGPLAGTVASVAIVLMPRLFAHAHLAALDMLTTVFFVAAVLAVADAVRDGRMRFFVLAGVLWGATILVRLHGLLVAPPVVLWLIWRLRREAVRPLLVWLSAGVATVFIGWPWLWVAPITHFHYFLTSGTGRESLHVFYGGQVWADRAAPWHYPWVMVLVTVPVGLLVLAALGGWAKCWPTRSSPAVVKDSDGFDAKGEGALLLAVPGFLLLVFSLPRTPVYDGERLFLMVFPILAIWVGIGAKWLVEKLMATKLPRALCYAGVVLFLAFQATGLIVYFPCHLSYYNGLVGGLAGASRLGFEVTYWGDSVREPMLAEAVRLSHGKPVGLAPNLAPFQCLGIQISSPAFHEAKATLGGWEPSGAQDRATRRYAIVYNRRADLAVAEPLLDRGRVVTCYEMQGVWLAKLLELDASSGL